MCPCPLQGKMAAPRKTNFKFKLGAPSGLVSTALAAAAKVLSIAVRLSNMELATLTNPWQSNATSWQARVTILGGVSRPLSHRQCIMHQNPPKDM